jgi:hypothetical protein
MLKIVFNAWSMNATRGLRHPVESPCVLSGRAAARAARPRSGGRRYARSRCLRDIAHQHDRGVAGLLRYLRLFPHMWTSEVGSEVVRSIAPAPGERVVDLGAGMGSASVLAVRTGARVIAVDPTSYMRRILRLRRRWQRDRAEGGTPATITSSMRSTPKRWRRRSSRRASLAQRAPARRWPAAPSSASTPLACARVGAAS